MERRYPLELLSDVLHKPLALVIAPSGYGKTTIVRSFFKKHPEIKNFWITIGHQEVDDNWVWKKFCDCFKNADAGFYEMVSGMGFPQAVNEIDALIVLIREYMHETVFMVIDDYHNCSSEQMNQLISRLVFEEIPELHVILISCTYPDILYEEMLVKGYCTLINQSAMVLSKEETESIFLMNEIRLKPDELERICMYTDGWISAVCLALMEYKRTGKFERYTSISRLLKSAVFDKIPVSLQRLLMKMSLFEEFTLEEAFYISECTMHPYVLMEMKEEFGFIHFDANTRKYAIHTLLKSVAYAELEKSEEDIRHIFLRAGDWCSKNKEYIKALLYYRYAECSDKVFELLSGEERNFIFESIPTVVKDFFSGIPLQEKSRHPVSYLGYIYYVIEKEDVDRGRKMFNEIVSEYQKRPDFNNRYDEFRGELYIMRARLWFNDLGKSIEAMKEADRLLKHQPSRLFRQNLLTYGTPSMTILYFTRPGSLKQVIALEKEYSRYYMRLINGNGGDWDEFSDAEYAVLTGRIEEAGKLSVVVREKAQFRKQTCVVISSYFIQLRGLTYQGAVQEFYSQMALFHNEMKEISRPTLRMDYELACGYLYAGIGRMDLIAGWLKDFNLEQCSLVVRTSKTAAIVYGLVLMNQKNWSLLDTLGEQLLVPSDEFYFGLLRIYGNIFKAIAAVHQSGMEKACVYMKEVLALTEPDDIRMPLIEQAEEVLPILEWMKLQTAYVSEVKRQCRHYLQSIKKFEKEKQKVSLTKRETELMHLVKEGYRNSEIGEKMGIALVTVEKNLTSIYRKLNVSNRAAAVAQFEEYV